MAPMQPRHHDVTRLEGFSDAVFAFALTLLVVSLEAPKTFAQLESLVRGALPFALMSGFVYFLVGPALTWNGYRGGTAERAILQNLGGDYPTP